jgi:hypothetical protein
MLLHGSVAGVLVLLSTTLPQAPPAAAAPPKDCSEVVVAPANGAVLTAQNPDAYELNLQWRPITGVEAYGIEVGSQANVSSVLSVKPLKQTSYSPRGLKPGHYYWRVSGADGRFVGPVCEFTLTAGAIPAGSSAVAAIPSGRPLTREGSFYCNGAGGGKAPTPFGTFFVSGQQIGGKSVDVLKVCVADKLQAVSFAHAFLGELGLGDLSSKTLHAGLVSLPNGTGLLVAVLSPRQGSVLVCQDAHGVQAVPLGRACTGAGVSISVPDPQQPALIEMLLPGGRKETLRLVEMIVP